MLRTLILHNNKVENVNKLEKKIYQIIKQLYFLKYETNLPIFPCFSILVFEIFSRLYLRKCSPGSSTIQKIPVSYLRELGQLIFTFWTFSLANCLLVVCRYLLG